MKYAYGAIALCLVAFFILVQSTHNTVISTRIGVITALTGDFGFYGESTRPGILLAQKDLKKEGVDVEFIFEDAQLDAAKALNAVQKLVNVDGVQAVYSEFTPPAIATASFLKGKNVLNLYAAAVVSPLGNGRNIYKTYIDYTEGCRKTAQYLKNQGIQSVGVLEANAEFARLCAEGVRAVYGTNAQFEKYQLGTTDFRTSLVKLKKRGAEALFNAAFPPETLASLRQAREIGIDGMFVAEADAFSPEVVAKNPSLFKNTLVFGLPPVSEDFVQRLKKELPTENVSYVEAAALGYIHAKQLAHTIQNCADDIACSEKEMDRAKPETIIAFLRFNNRAAEFAMPLRTFDGGMFVIVQ